MVYNDSRRCGMQNVLFSIFPNENFIDLALYQYGWEQCTPSHSFGPAARNHYLFHYIISGTGVLIAEDKSGINHTYHIKSGEGFLLFPHQIAMYMADQKLPWEYVWIEFDGLRVKESLQIAGLSQNNPVYHSHSAELRRNMTEEMLYIVHHAKESPFHLLGHGYLFLDYFTRSVTPVQLSHSGKMQDFYIREAIAFIEQNFQNDISVEDIAACCGLNRSYFGAIFRRSIGQTPQDFLIHYRMVKAAELLKLTQLSVQDISNAVGYANPLHFSRAFKKVYGSSPRIWRNQNQIKKKKPE